MAQKVLFIGSTGIHFPRTLFPAGVAGWLPERLAERVCQISTNTGEITAEFRRGMTEGCSGFSTEIPIK